MSRFRADGSFKHDGYWRKVRRRVLLRDGGLCQIRGPGCTVKATQVDHIVPVNAGGALYDEANLRAACQFDNKSREDQSRKRRKVKPSREW
jgi:5-methylcytosine-specific restriction endonuclease McrA